MPTLHSLALADAATTQDESGVPVPPARVLVGRYLVSLFAHAEDAFRIRVGRRVEVLPRYSHSHRVPVGVYEVVKHHRTDGVAYVSIRAAKPRIPGGRIDPHVHPRVAVNDVNPVPFWGVFPAAVYGPESEVLPGLAARGFPAQEMALLADRWAENGLSFAPLAKLADGVSFAHEPQTHVSGEEFAAEWFRFMTEAAKVANPVQFAPSFAANHANHHPQG